jgi:hypothetical protein
MAPRLKILMSSGSKKRTQIYHPFLSKRPGKRIPSKFPNGAPYPLTRHFYVSLNIYLFIFPSESPVRQPSPCFQTWSPWTGIVHHQSHWSTHSFMYVCWSPQKEPSYIWGKTKTYRPRSPTYTEGLHTVGCGLVPQGDR